MPLPKTFDDLATAFNKPPHTFVNIIGIVVHNVAPPMPLRNGQYLFTFKLLDLSLAKAAQGSAGLMCRFFKEDEEDLPKVRNIGDVVLLRSIKMFNHNGQVVALAHHSTLTLVFPRDSIPAPAFSIGYVGKSRIECLGVPAGVAKFNLEEQEYIIQFKEFMNNQLELMTTESKSAVVGPSTTIDPPPAKRQKISGNFSQKFRLIKDLQPQTWADICGIVVKRISAQYGDRVGCDMYITDYTVNEKMRYYDPLEDQASHSREGDDFGYSASSKKSWHGPFEWYVLKVNLKPPHAEYANKNIKENDVVLLRNVKMVIKEVGTWLEGDMWHDDMEPNMVKVRKITDLTIPEVQEMMKRKEKYWSTHRTNLVSNPHDGQHLSKKKRKRLKKEEQRARAKANQSPAISSTNAHVRCNYSEVTISTIREILDRHNLRHTNTSPHGTPYLLPFINARYRARVRVVDYQPKDLEDFSVPRSSTTEDSSSHSCLNSESWIYGSPAKYEWCFSLLLEDASARLQNAATTTAEANSNRIWVHLQHEQAQFLLGKDMDDPDDLRQDPTALAKLREKLFILWGELEEKGGGAARSKLPFECCIEEYGLEREHEGTVKPGPLHSWQRMYSMFGTTIL